MLIALFMNRDKLADFLESRTVLWGWLSGDGAGLFHSLSMLDGASLIRGARKGSVFGKGS